MKICGQRFWSTVMLAASLTVPAAVAEAQPRPYGRHGDWHHGGYHRGGYDHGNGGNTAAAAIGGALLGLGVGALVGSALSQQAAAPPPGAYYPPPPPGAAYGPPPGAYYP